MNVGEAILENKRFGENRFRKSFWKTDSGKNEFGESFGKSIGEQIGVAKTYVGKNS